MGGERETFAEKKPSKESKEGTKLGKFRIHQNAGEVHFHDDEAKLKVAVPVADWWKAWEKLRTESSQFEWCDTVNDTILTVETTISEDVIDATITITEAVYGANFKALNDFTKRK